MTRRIAMHRRNAARRHAGFTLVEVLVALFILAIMSGMAFRGVDALLHAKDGALAATNRTLKLNTGMAQFDYDVSQIVDSKVLPQALMWDGASLRFARRTPQGIQLVMWTLQDHRWQRWAGAPVTHMADLTDEWMRSQQWDGISSNAVTVLQDVSDFQVYVCNPNGTPGSGTGCSWNNGGTTQGTPGTAQIVVPGQGNNNNTPGQGGGNGTSGSANGSANGGANAGANSGSNGGGIVTNPNQATAQTTTTANTAPVGVRILLKLPEGDITREKELPHWS